MPSVKQILKLSELFANTGDTSMRYLAFIFVLAASISVDAQLRTFKWQSEVCDLTGTYNAKKYSAAQLRNTLKLFGASAPQIAFNAAVWKYDEIARLDLVELDREYHAKSKMVRDLDIVKVPFWENLRQATLKEMQQYYELSRTTVQAYTRPEVINEYRGAESCKALYARPIIAGGEGLIAAWRQVNLDSQKRNADPESLQKRWESENASPDRLKYALVETMAFGWWNCANGFIERPEQANDGTAENEFKRLFTRVKEVCEEP